MPPCIGGRKGNFVKEAHESSPDPVFLHMIPKHMTLKQSPCYDCCPSSTPEIAMKYFLVSATFPFASMAAIAQPAHDETTIRAIVQEEAAAWNSGDAVAYSRHFAA